ncbi:xanthine dehydrogenase family protein molybdopterin-binding subunit [Chloroflexota bacterium]
MYGLNEGEAYKPWLWIPPEGGSIGQMRLGRRDGFDKASGKAIYSRDIFRPGMLFAKHLHSPHPHAKIVSMDTSKAEDLPGVRAVLRYDDPEMVWPTDSGHGDYAQWYPQPVGAIVVADTELLVDEALRLIDIEWEELPFIMDWNEALEPGAPILFPETNPDNNIKRERGSEIGDAEAGMAEADNIIEVEFNIEPDSVAGVEGGCCVAEVIGNDAVRLWPHCQQWSPLSLREGSALLQAFPWLKANKLFVNTQMVYNGAMFGALVPRRADALKGAILAAKATGKPVKFLLDYQHFAQLGEHLGTYQMTIGFKDNGEVTAVRYHTIMSSAFGDHINKIEKGSKVANIAITQMYPYTNVGGYSCYKHGDAPCSCHAEVFEQVAAALGMDPTDVAILNDGCYGHDMEWVKENVKAEQGFDPNRDSLKEQIEIGKTAMDWDNKWHQPGTKILPNGNYHGIGFIWHISWSHTNSRVSLGMRMHNDGTVAVLGQSADVGVNRDTTYCQVAADELGLSYENVYLSSFVYSGFDTKEPGGSSGMAGTLPSVVRCAKKLKALILELAATKERPGSWGAPPRPPFFEGVTPDQLDLKDGVVFEKANPENSFPIRDIASSFGGSTPNFLFTHVSDLPSQTEKAYCMGRQCYFMEVEVNPDTGNVDVKKMVVTNDAGRLMNPESFEGQQYGGSYMGIGRCNQEQIIWDPQTGVRLTDNLINYDIALMNDCEQIDCFQIETGLGYGSYGTFGIGESGGACVASLSRYAVHNAIGKWVDLKTTPDKILKALGKV